MWVVGCTLPDSVSRCHKVWYVAVIDPADLHSILFLGELWFTVLHYFGFR
jgi:hypothetical protein